MLSTQSNDFTDILCGVGTEWLNTHFQWLH